MKSQNSIEKKLARPSRVVVKNMLFADLPQDEANYNLAVAMMVTEVRRALFRLEYEE